MIGRFFESCSRSLFFLKGAFFFDLVHTYVFFFGYVWVLVCVVSTSVCVWFSLLGIALIV